MNADSHSGRSRASDHASEPRRSRASHVTARELLGALAIASVGALGAVPGKHSGPDPFAAATWIAIVSLPSGCVAAAVADRAWPLALVPPAIWMGVLAFVDASSTRDLATPQWAALAWTGLFLSGFGLARAFRERAVAIACAAFLCASFLAWIPLAPKLFEPMPAARARARAIALSPVTLVLECAGADLLRHPVLYAAAETADLDPSVYSPYRGKLAGPVVFLVGCAAVAAGGWFARQRARHRTTELDRERALDPRGV